MSDLFVFLQKKNKYCFLQIKGSFPFNKLLLCCSEDSSSHSVYLKIRQHVYDKEHV